jgi:hypothetical protein
MWFGNVSWEKIESILKEQSVYVESLFFPSFSLLVAFVFCMLVYLSGQAQKIINIFIDSYLTVVFIVIPNNQYLHAKFMSVFLTTVGYCGGGKI